MDETQRFILTMITAAGGTIWRGEDFPFKAPLSFMLKDEEPENIEKFASMVDCVITENMTCGDVYERLRKKMTGINKITRDDVNFFRDVHSHRETAPDNSLNTYQRIATKSAIYPGQGTPLGLAYVALKLNGEAGEFAEHVGKAMRDDGLITIDFLSQDKTNAAIHFEPLTPERRALIIKEIGDVLWYLSAACNELNISLSEAASTNLEKLCDRSERDALRGSGDER
jgi:NTP pyrophosphatase (non-canonical NTP hydrolase)